MVADATNPALRFDESVRFTVEGADGAALSGWRPVAYAVTERVHAPWEARVELVADGDGSEGTAWIDRALTLRLVRGAQSRVWRGVVTEVESAVTPEEGATVLRRVRITVASRVALLAQETDGRVFQHRTLEAIARTVCQRAGIASERVTAHTTTDVVPRAYRVQWHEDSLHFLQRVTAEEGVTLCVEPSAEGDRLRLCDVPATWPCTAEEADPVGVYGSEALAQGQTGIAALSWVTGRTPNPVYLRDQDWTRPKYAVSGPRDDGPGRAETPMRFEYPAGVEFTGYDPTPEVRRYAGDNLARLVTARTEMLQGAALRGRGRGNCLRIQAGRRVWVREGTTGARETMVLSVLHEGWLRQEGVAHDATRPDYDNRFELVPTRVPGEDGRPGASLPYRPARLTAPRVGGVLRGTVARPVSDVDASVSPDTDVDHEIVTDVHGRVLVRFHWDQSDHQGDQGLSSCWVRVMRPWAGGDFGYVFTPRVGTEVLVGFEDGDPDRPVVLGGLHDGTHRPPTHASPHSVEHEKTRSVIRTRSTHGGTGYNELSFEDLKSREEVFLRAERNLRELVRNDRLSTIQHDEHTTVGHDSTLTVGHDDVHKVEHDRVKRVGNDEVAEVGNDRRATVHRHETLNTLGHQWVVVGEGDARAYMPPESGDQGVCVTACRRTFVGRQDWLTVGENFRLDHVDMVTSISLNRARIELLAPERIELCVGESKLVMEHDRIELRAGNARVVIGGEQGRVKLTAAGGGHLQVIGESVELNC